MDIKDVEDVKGRKRTCIHFKIWVTSSKSTFMISFDLVASFFSRFNIPLRPRNSQVLTSQFRNFQNLFGNENAIKHNFVHIGLGVEILKTFNNLIR